MMLSRRLWGPISFQNDISGMLENMPLQLSQQIGLTKTFPAVRLGQVKNQL